MRDELGRALRAQRRAMARARVRRVTSGLEHARDVRADESPMAIGARLTPAEHWRPQGGPVALEGGATAGLVARPLRRRSTLFDRFLMAVEVIAVVGLVAALVQSLGLVRRLQQDVRAMPPANPPGTVAWLRPSATPRVTLATATQATATKQPKATSTATRIRLATATASITPATPKPAASATATATPRPTLVTTPDSPTGVRFVIPAIGVNAPMVEGDNWETLKSGIGHRTSTAWPGEPGNVVVSAHNDVYGSIFRDLGQLKAGDPVFAYTPGGVYRYEVVSSRIVLPTETGVIQPTGEPILTLITCYPPYIDTHRIVVTARLVQ